MALLGNVMLLGLLGAIVNFIAFELVAVPSDRAQIAALFRANTCGASEAACWERYENEGSLRGGVAFALSWILTPAAGYIYCGKPWHAALFVLTFGGLGIWLIIGLYDVLVHVRERNMALAAAVASGSRLESTGERVAQLFRNARR